MIAKYQWKLGTSVFVRSWGYTDILLIDRDNDVVVAEYIVPLRPIFHGVIIDSVPSLGISGKALEELRRKKVDSVY